jgi:hypothetical protein
MAKEKRPQPEPERARVLEAQAQRHYNAGRSTDAITSLREAIAVWRALAMTQLIVQTELARCLRRLAFWELRAGADLEAKAAMAECLMHWRALVQLDADKYAIDFARAVREQVFMVNPPPMLPARETVSLCEEAMHLLAQLLPRDEARFLEPTATAYLDLANLVTAESRKAALYAGEAVRLWKQLASSDLLQHGPRLVKALHRAAASQMGPDGIPADQPRREARRVARRLLVARMKYSALSWVHKTPSQRTERIESS